MRRIALPLSLLLALAACGPEPSEQSDTITIEFWTIALGDAFADYILGMISTYEEAHPGVKIKWVDVSGGEVAEKFLAALVGDTPPDLANIYDLPRFLQYDILVDMDQAVPALDKAKRLDNFWRGVGYFQGANYVIPWYVGVTMLWYNKDLFQRAGLDPDRPPRTIDEMLAMGRQIYERTGKYGVSWRLHPSLVAPPWALLRMDGFWPLFDEGYNRTRINHPDEGRAAMLPFSGGWITRYFDKTFEQKVATAPMPRGALGRVPASNQVLVVPKASRHREIAVDFGLFVTNDENQLEFCRQVAILPSTKAAAADPYFRRPAATLADQANQLSAADIPNSFVMAPPDVVGWSRMEDILHEEFAKALAQQQSVDEALARIEQKWNHLLRYQ